MYRRTGVRDDGLTDRRQELEDDEGLTVRLDREPERPTVGPVDDGVTGRLQELDPEEGLTERLEAPLERPTAGLEDPEGGTTVRDEGVPDRWTDGWPPEDDPEEGRPTGRRAEPPKPPLRMGVLEVLGALLPPLPVGPGSVAGRPERPGDPPSRERWMFGSCQAAGSGRDVFPEAPLSSAVRGEVEVCTRTGVRTSRAVVVGVM